jgi:co-chaperonin GroES (HSP10)
MEMVNNSIACKDLDDITKEKGGFILATNKDNYKRLKVTNVFEGCELVKSGDEVFVMKSAGIDIPVGGEDYVVIKQQDILLIS